MASVCSWGGAAWAQGEAKPANATNSTKATKPSAQSVSPAAKKVASNKPETARRAPAAKVAAKPTSSRPTATRAARAPSKAAASRGVGVGAKAQASARVSSRVAAVARPQSFGRKAGLHLDKDPLALASGVALVVDQETDEVLFSKNTQAVLPIASITKLMTGLLIVESGLPLDERLAITEDDRDTEKGTGSRLMPGTVLTREEMLHLALMASENRAAHALGRTFPGGKDAFVAAMNAKASLLGMQDTRYVEPTGLSSQNQSSAKDLATLVKAAMEQPLLREFSTSPELKVSVGRRQLAFHTTNRLVKDSDWDIGIQKTGFINEAGQCLVMQAKLAGRKLILVFLDSAGKYSRIADAERVRKWLVSSGAAAAAFQSRPRSAGPAAL